MISVVLAGALAAVGFFRGISAGLLAAPEL